MATLHIRNVGDELVNSLKIRAIRYNMTLRELVIRELSDAVIEPAAIQAGSAKEVAERIAESPIESKILKHDVKGCRVYRCGQCRELGVRDKNRGLV